ncbi:BA75_01066T0 [Komagataella pastoris]|uniref:DNA damage-binding protein CMR1 n=1 Tax=Komagataella pastoris TaxID=4922 RepID=A0A1B2JA67_PICPA|nr:BA75_01066T0 [Komagataella pastoris]
MPISELERKRQANIARNQLLLKDLELEKIKGNFYSELAPKKGRNLLKKVKRNQNRISAIPVRRSRRIAGVKLQDSQDDLNLPAENAKNRPWGDSDFSENLRLEGNLKLNDVLGNEPDTVERLRKSFYGKDHLGTVLEHEESKNCNDGDIVSLRDELGSLNLFKEFDPSKIRLTSQRMTSIQFHPYVDRKIVIGGDKTGQIGIWSTTDKKVISLGEDYYQDYEPVVTHLKLHGKNISRIQINAEEPKKVYSASYDGSVRCLDLGKLLSENIMSFDDATGTAEGITDINFVNPNVYYFTTLSGLFGQHDLRTPESTKEYKVLRCHDKKIGSFAINPSLSSQFTTASLDRSLRVWDLRKISTISLSQNKEPYSSPTCVGSFISKLSVSGTDWNGSGDIVCNGYANEINIFSKNSLSLPKSSYSSQRNINLANNGTADNLIPDHILKHNCQTGRWVSILKAKWQTNPSDGIEKFVIANMNRGFDVYCSDGRQVGDLRHALMNAVPAVNCFHPSQNWLVGGSASGKCYLFDNEKE